MRGVIDEAIPLEIRLPRRQNGLAMTYIVCMGLIRFLLAISVIFAHVSISNKFFLGGPMALELFFIISGYSIAYVIDRKYRFGTNGYWNFLYQRFLRIFPLYWTILLLAVGYSFFLVFFHLPLENTLQWFLAYRHSFGLILSMAIANIALFGQDVLFFIGIHNGLPFFTSNFQSVIPRLDYFMFIPQAWAISLELVFYVLAFLLMKLKTRWLMIGICISALTRIYFYWLGYAHDPWTYRFFPFELLFFLLGMVSYRLAKVFLIKINNIIKILLFSSLIIIIILFRSLPIYELSEFNFLQWAFYLLFVMLLPYLFPMFHGRILDKILGDLSYPMYLSHVFIASVLTVLRLPGFYYGLAVIGGTIVFSELLVLGILRPIERYRNNFLRK